jgi:hypothetical protein
MYRVRRFFRKCYNVIRWLPTIWKDEDWDHQYITTILLKKLEHQRDFFLSTRAHSSQAKDAAEQIQKAIDMLRKTDDSWEYYECPIMREMDAKWGEGVVRFIPIPGTDSSEMHIDYDGVKTDEDRQQYSKEFREGMMKAEKLYKKEKREAYKYLADHIDYWWD